MIEPRFDHRLVPWNLFFSASAYERKNEIGWSSIADLSTLIDALCLYDRFVVLGDPEKPPFAAHTSDFFEAFKTADVIKVVSLNLDQESQVSIAVTRHLALFVGEHGLPNLETWIQEALRRNDFAIGGRDRPTMNREVRLSNRSFLKDAAKEQLTTRLLQEKSNSALNSFVTRTFMYYSTSEVLGIPVTSDAIRANLMQQIVNNERAFFREQILQKIQQSWQDYPTHGFQGLRRHVSPFAAIVFERCDGKPARIVKEMFEIRFEFSYLRERLHQLEQRYLYGIKRRCHTRREAMVRGTD